MAKMNELYVRQPSQDNLLSMSDPEQMWDDSSMTAAYDKAISKANAEIAKQIAMETNSKFKENAKPNVKKGKGPLKQAKAKWEKGMSCRAVFVDDGIEYEAVITAIVDKDDCVVKFLGYGNSEIVSISSLKESLGDEALMRQIEDARYDDSFESQSNDGEFANAGAHAGQAMPKQKKGNKKSNKGNLASKGPNNFKLPDLAGMSSIFNRAVMPDNNMPNIPCPPPLPPCLRTNTAEDQALSSMLMSWYMSGYQTGLYQGLRRANANASSNRANANASSNR